MTGTHPPWGPTPWHLRLFPFRVTLVVSFLPKARAGSQGFHHFAYGRVSGPPPFYVSLFYTTKNSEKKQENTKILQFSCALDLLNRKNFFFTFSKSIFFLWCKNCVLPANLLDFKKIQNAKNREFREFHEKIAQFFRVLSKKQKKNFFLIQCRNRWQNKVSNSKTLCFLVFTGKNTYQS